MALQPGAPGSSQAVAAIAPLLQPGADDQRAASTHKLLWSLFARTPEDKRDFLWREVGGAGPRKEYYVLSPTCPANGLGLFEVETKPYRLAPAAGDRFSFDVRVNATVSRIEGGKHVRHDVVMDALHSLPPGQARREARDTAAQEAGSVWFSRKGERAGFTSGDDVTVQAYQTWKLPRGRARPLKLGVIDVKGTLTVEDPVAFVPAVLSGFGKGLAFGLGMMLLRRA